jgi:hypothetical protein
MNAVTVDDIGSLLQAIEGSCRGIGGHVIGTRLVGKEPSLGLELSPVGPQFLQKSLGQQSVTILSTLALLDANQHPIGVNVARLQPHQLRDTQTRAVGGHHEDAVLLVVGGVDQPGNLFTT